MGEIQLLDPSSMALAARKQLSLIPELNLVDVDDVGVMLARGGLRRSTILRYRGAARAWITYCRDRGEEPHDASTPSLMRWLDWRCRDAKSPHATLRMSVAAARFVQRALCAVHGLEAVPYTPKSRMQLDAFFRSVTMQRGQLKQARPLLLDELGELVRLVRRDVEPRPGVDAQTAKWLADRDAAMLLVGWWGALRSDDIARLTRADIRTCISGLELHIRGSKTDDKTAVLALGKRDDCPELCPWRAWTFFGAWLSARREGSAFSLSRAEHVRRRMLAIFTRHGVPEGYSGHSLRAGFATEAAVQNVSDKLVQNHGRWRSAEQHANYVRSGRLWLDTPTIRMVCPKQEEAA